MGFSEWTWDLFHERFQVGKLWLKYHPDKPPYGSNDAFCFLKNAVATLNKHSLTWSSELRTVEDLRYIVDPQYEQKQQQASIKSPITTTSTKRKFAFSFADELN